MPFRPLRLVGGRATETPPPSASGWPDTADESVPPPEAAREAAAAPPAAEPAGPPPQQLSLFVFEDVAPAPRPPRLKRLKGLLAALESQREGLDEVAGLEAAAADRPAQPGKSPKRARPGKQRQPAAAPPPAPAPLWPDSFFDD